MEFPPRDVARRAEQEKLKNLTNEQLIMKVMAELLASTNNYETSLTYRAMYCELKKRSTHE